VKGIVVLDDAMRSDIRPAINKIVMFGRFKRPVLSIRAASGFKPNTAHLKTSRPLLWIDHTHESDIRGAPFFVVKVWTRFSSYDFHENVGGDITSRSLASILHMERPHDCVVGIYYRVTHGLYIEPSSLFALGGLTGGIYGISHSPPLQKVDNRHSQREKDASFCGPMLCGHLVLLWCGFFLSGLLGFYFSGRFLRNIDDPWRGLLFLALAFMSAAHFVFTAGKLFDVMRTLNL
jgi:hypothetical protein